MGAGGGGAGLLVDRTSPVMSQRTTWQTSFDWKELGFPAFNQ